MLDSLTFITMHHIFFFLDSYSVKNIIVFVQIFPFVFLLIFKAVNIVSWVNKVDAPAFL